MAGAAIKVGLRRPVLADAEARVGLGISTEIARMYGVLTENHTVVGKRQAATWLRKLQRHPHAWVIKADGEMVGEVRLDGLNLQDRRARLAIGLFHDRHLGRGIGRKAINLVLYEAFESLGLHRVDLRVLAYNQRAIRCYEACGFVREGIERDSARVGDDWHDDWIMAILEEEYRRRNTVSSLP
jgi:RimJ/RimL family protein N-acetyltransferase